MKKLCIAILCLSYEIALAQEGFRPLFNGKDFSGWHIAIDDKGTEKNLFSVEDGIIHVYAAQKDQSTQSFGGIITDKEFSNYIIKLEYKWGEKKFAPRQDFVRDAGILFHLHGAEEIWPNSVECQIQEGDTGDIWLVGTQGTSKVNEVIRNYSPDGELVTRGLQTPRFSRFHRGYSWEKPGWNEVTLEINGDDAKYYVNGHLVNEVIDMKRWNNESRDWRPLTKGKILLQAEGAELFYRNIMIKEL